MVDGPGGVSTTLLHEAFLIRYQQTDYPGSGKNKRQVLIVCALIINNLVFFITEKVNKKKTRNFPQS